MEGIAPRIETGLLLESGCELPTGFVSRKQSLSGRVSGPQSVADSFSRSCQIQKRLVGVTDRHRLKFAAKFQLHGSSLLHPLRTPQNRRLSDALSSPDRLHRMPHIRNQNRGTRRNGLIDEETFRCLCELQTEPRINLAYLRSTLNGVDSFHVDLPSTRLKGLLSENHLRGLMAPS